MPNATENEHAQYILLVEDDVFLRDIFSRKLQNSSFDLLTADNSKDAIEIAQEKHPQVILLDLNLPGESGFEVLKAVKGDEKLKDIIVLILTNSVLSEDIIKSNELQADDFLTKANFSMDEILERIESHLERKVVG